MQPSFSINELLAPAPAKTLGPFYSLRSLIPLKPGAIFVTPRRGVFPKPSASLQATPSVTPKEPFFSPQNGFLAHPHPSSGSLRWSDIPE